MSSIFSLLFTSQEIEEWFENECSEEDLYLYWKLSDEEIDFVDESRGFDNRTRIALQLMSVKHFGCFIINYNKVPVNLLNYINSQLNLEPIMFLERSREATESEYRDRIRKYLALHAWTSRASDEILADIPSSITANAPFELVVHELIQPFY